MEVVHIQKVAELNLVEDTRVVGHNCLPLLVDHNLAVKMHYILVAEKHLVVHIDLVDQVYMQLLEVLDN